VRTSLASLFGAALLAATLQAAEPYREWTVYGGGPDSIRYSTLDQINRENVSRLEVAWTFDTGDAFPDSEMECNPIVVNGLLYATTPKLRLIALGAATGQLRWTFDPRQNEPAFGKQRNRGVTCWSGGALRCGFDRKAFTVVEFSAEPVDARLAQNPRQHFDRLPATAG